jgi:hypothetical protein
MKPNKPRRLKPDEQEQFAGQLMLEMKKLIRNKATGAFLAEGGDWTTDCRRAQIFPTTEEVRGAVLKHALKDVELYYLFGAEPTAYDFTISL